MKKYFIAGKEIHTDKKLESGSLQNYYELGFECVYTHLLAKRCIKDGSLDPNKDIVVTCEGREFFYDKHIKTISWKEFERISTKQEITISINASDFLVDGILHETKFFHDFYMEGSKPFDEIYNKSISNEENYKKYLNQGIPKYKFFDEDYDIITDLNFNLEFKIPDQKYICINRRHRKHREELNMPIKYTEDLIRELQKTFNCKIFITGFHNEIFSNKNGFENVEWVTLRDWCTLLNHNNCMAVIQNQTGTANLSQICGKTKLLNIVLDMEMAHSTNPFYFNGRRPDVLGKAVNFKQLRNIIYKKLGNITDIIDNIKQYA